MCSRLTFLCRAIVCGLLLLSFANAYASTETRRLGEATPTPFKGERLDTLVVGKTVYQIVEVQEVRAVTLVFRHAKGIGSARLRDLSPELRAHFGYDAEKERAEIEQERLAGETAKFLREQAKGQQGAAKMAAAQRRYERLAQAFTRPPELRAEMDLRPRMRDMELQVKRQGRRPSCAIFAVVSALEYLNAEAYGKAELFSEEYLIWATAKVTGRLDRGETDAPPDDRDYGFRLVDVVAAMRAYGIVNRERMPNSQIGRYEQIQSPSAALIEEARTRLIVRMHPVPAREGDRGSLILAMVHALNEGIPLCVGVEWPPDSTCRAGYLNAQKAVAGSGHAVLIVGYVCPDGKPESLRFIFKNSWGPNWGMGGYGEFSQRYLSAYLHDVVLLEVG